jgi:2'-5' RNA ligase
VRVPTATKFKLSNNKTMPAGNARVFFALWPDAAIRSRLHQINGQIPESQGRFVTCDNLHITLSFIGEVGAEQLQVYARAAGDINSAPFALGLDRLGYFARTRVLWLGCESAPAGLLALVKQLNKVLSKHGYQAERRPFMPHVTLIRNARPPAALPEIEPVSWNIDGFALVQSLPQRTGVSYRVLKEYKFAC